MINQTSNKDNINYNLLNKKRAKVRFSKSKSKKRKYIRHIDTQTPKKLYSNQNFKKRDMKQAIENIRHFFHINWDDKIFYNGSIKIGQSINDNIYWFLINCSYFKEEKIYDYIDILKEVYLKNDDDILYSNSNSYDSNQIEEEYNKKKSIYMNKYDLYYYISSISELKKKIINQLNMINEINKNNLNILGQRAIYITEKLENNNNINDENGNLLKCFEENPIYPKNKLSSLIKSKFLSYLYHKEKNNLMRIINHKLTGKKIEKNNDIDNENKDINICCICNNCDLNHYELIFQCIKCGLQVHSSCYGIKPTIDQKKWKCEMCKEISKEESIKLECLLCPNKLGALKKINIPQKIYQNLMSNRSRHLKFNNNKSIIESKERYIEYHCQWVHLSCLQWNKNIKFSISNLKRNINILELNNYDNLIKICNICNKSSYGPTVKCSFNDCKFYCHPECARINNFYLEIEKDNKDSNLKYNLYCHEHYPNKYEKIRNNITKNAIEDVFTFDEILCKIYKLSENHYNHKYNKVNKNEYNEYDSSMNHYDTYDTQNNSKNRKITKVTKFTKISKISKINEKKYLNKVNNISIFNIYGNKNSYSNNKLFKINQNNKEKKYNLINKGNCMSKIIINYNNNINHWSEKKQTNIHEKNNSIYSDLTQHQNDYINSNSLNSNKNNSLTDISMIQFEKEIEENKESFIIYLIGYLYDYFKNNRIVLMKENGYYSFPQSVEEYNSIYDMDYEDLFSKDIPLNGIHYKDLTINMIKKYLRYIFPDQQKFEKLFISQIDSVLKRLKENEKFKNKEICCQSQFGCKGSKNGIFKLLSIEQFKYQILTEKNIPNTFFCEACLDNIELKK